MSEDVLSFLSASAEYHLLDVINDASNFRARGKRSRLTVDDVTASLELRGAEVKEAVTITVWTGQAFSDVVGVVRGGEDIVVVVFP